MGGFPTTGNSDKWRISGLEGGGNLDHKLADCGNIDLLTDLAEVIPVIVKPRAETSALC